MRLIIPFLPLLIAPLCAAADDLDANAVAMFEATYGRDQCLNYHADRPAPIRREVSVDGSSGPQTVTTFEFACDIGAYNEVRAFLMNTQTDGLLPASFPAPVPDVHYVETAENVGDLYAGPVDRIDIRGYIARPTLTNPSVDEATGQITTWEKWRGIGDASSSGVWDLTPDGYVLRRYDIDATYDGVNNPMTVLDLECEATAQCAMP